MRIFALFFIVAIGFGAGCQTSTDSQGTAPTDRQDSNSQPQSAAPAEQAGEKTDLSATRSGQPRTIREFFMELPERFFTLEGCDKATDKDCRKAKLEYLRSFTEVEDTANGYLKGGCDGAQSCLEMTIFRKPDSTYLVAVSVEAEMMMEQFFLDYADGKWTDIAAEAIPQYSQRYIYELPRQGTTVRVFEKKVIEKGDDYEIVEKGPKIYDLTWQNGKFEIKK